MRLTFKPTATCPKFPTNPGMGKFRKPVPELSDEDVDTCLQFMLEHGAEDMHLPLTQYGRRVAVMKHLRWEKYQGLEDDQQPWRPAHPIQPR